MFPRRFIPFLLAFKIAATQTVYSTTQVSYSTSAVPIVQTYPVSPTVPASISPSPITVTATPLPSSTAMSPSVTFIEPSMSPVSLTSKFPSKDASEPKAYFLPATIPDPKVTILPHDLPSVVEVKPRTCTNNGFPEINADKCPVTRRDNRPMTAVKRITMACTDDFSPSDLPLCPGFPKLDMSNAPIMTKDPKCNPIDHAALFDSFMTCL